MKNRRFMVVRVARLQLVHGFFISQCASAVVEFVGVSIKRLDSGNVIPLSLRLDAG